MATKASHTGNSGCDSNSIVTIALHSSKGHLAVTVCCSITGLWVLVTTCVGHVLQLYECTDTRKLVIASSPQVQYGCTNGQPESLLMPPAHKYSMHVLMDNQKA